MADNTVSQSLENALAFLAARIHRETETAPDLTHADPEQLAGLVELATRLSAGIGDVKDSIGINAEQDDDAETRDGAHPSLAAERTVERDAHDYAVNTALGAIHSIHAIARALLDNTGADSDALLATILRESERARESLDSGVIWGFGR